MELLASGFQIDFLGFGLMGNHFHCLLQNRERWRSTCCWTGPAAKFATTRRGRSPRNYPRSWNVWVFPDRTDGLPQCINMPRPSCASLAGRSEKQSSTDRSNDLEDPEDQDSGNKKKRGQQPSRRGPTRRDYSHLPLREEFIDIPANPCACGRCGKPFVDMGQTEDSE